MMTLEGQCWLLARAQRLRLSQQALLALSPSPSVPVHPLCVLRGPEAGPRLPGHLRCVCRLPWAVSSAALQDQAAKPMLVALLSPPGGGTLSTRRELRYREPCTDEERAFMELGTVPVPCQPRKTRWLSSVALVAGRHAAHSGVKGRQLAEKWLPWQVGVLRGLALHLP